MSETGRLLVFISYNKGDKDIAANIAMFLSAENIATWIDEWEISAGDSILEEIQDGLRRCSHFIIIWSKNANKSNWVRAELKSALMRLIQEKSIKIIPIILDKTPLPEFLKDIKYIRYRGGAEETRHELIQAISGKQPTTNFIRAVVRKYHELVYDPEAKDPFGINYCPNCGSDKLKGSDITDYAGDEVYFILTCEECGWSTWSQ